jgi:hypothetical protein
MNLAAESLSRIKNISFINRETRKEEKVAPVLNPVLDSQGHLVFYTLNRAWRGVAPNDILEVNGLPASEFFAR